MSTGTTNIQQFLLDHVEQHPADLVAHTMEHFGVTRPAVHLHLKKLIEEGRILKTGSRRSTRYLPGHSAEKTWRYKLSADLQEDKIWKETVEPIVKPLTKNIYDICYYGLTEMINNAIDHSEGKTLILTMSTKDENLVFSVSDDGVGIFAKITSSFGLEDTRESILHLSKGKLTTDPKRHSGEGIFFTSRAFDRFAILSGELNYIRLNQTQDWFIETRQDSLRKGTNVCLTISQKSDRVLSQVFSEFQDPETHSFDKTNLFVKLAKLEEEQYVSRSQAKRLLQGAEQFRRLILDFQDVRTVGQAFVDEVFRVFSNEHPEIKIEYINANPDVLFMITRGLSTVR